MEDRKIDKHPRPSVCWTCARACGLKDMQCSWFGKERTLPAGCEYESREVLKQSTRGQKLMSTVYIVKKCPQFLEETEDVRAELREMRLKKAAYDGLPGGDERLYRLIFECGI